jgi:hypothetical protein
MESSQSAAVGVGKFATIGGKKFDIKAVMLGVLPSITGILVELLTVGKLSGKQRQLPLIREVLVATIAELDAIMDSRGVERL